MYLLTRQYRQNEKAIKLTVAVLLMGFIFYAVYGIIDRMMTEWAVSNILMSSKFKVTFENTTMKVFAMPRNNAIATIKPIMGNSIPETNSMVIGKSEADRMIEERLFTRNGDRIRNYYGMTVNVEGVLTETGSFLDKVNFISERNFGTIKGDQQRVFMRKSDGGIPTAFYRMDMGDELPGDLELAEGSLELYASRFEGEVEVLPIIIGFNEAQRIREKKVFLITGDTIENFFGRKVIVAGILKKSNGPADLTYLAPFVN